jgi:CRISPR/Cas system-associated exonuclease Cas4 (RecB family)
MQLTKNSLKNFSLKRLLFKFVEHFNVDPTLHAEARLHRVQLELKGASNIKPRDYSYHHASSLGIGGPKPEKCLRQLAYSVHFRESSMKEWSSLYLNKFETGHDAHAKYQGWLSFIYGEMFESEVPFRDIDLNMGGTCDGIIHIELDGAVRRLGIEIKTASESVIKGLKKPSNKYLDQGAAYVNALGLDAIIFLYEAKNTQQLHEFPYLAEELAERWERIEKRVREINDHLERGTWPKRDRSSDCKTCAFRRTCKPNQVKALNRAGLQPRLKEVIGKGG